MREVAERLREDGLNMRFDEWFLKPGDSILGKIEEGLDHSCVLVLCMSANARGSDGRRLEHRTVGRATPPFRDPANAGRSFNPLLLADRVSPACRVTFA